jgi:hypothetical protein
MKISFYYGKLPKQSLGPARFKVQGSKFKVQEKGFDWINITD